MYNSIVFQFKNEDVLLSWCRHQMETFSVLLAICAGNSPVSGEFHARRPVTRSFDVFFDLCLDGRLGKHSWGWWLETPSGPLWRQSNDCCNILLPSCHVQPDNQCWIFVFRLYRIWILTNHRHLQIFAPFWYGNRGGRFKKTYELLNLRALKFSPVNKIHIFQCMGKIFCVEFQRYPLKFHTKYLTHTLKDMTFIQHLNFKSS